MSEYPRLMWSPDGVEICVKSDEEKAAKLAEGYRLTAEAPPAKAQATDGEALDLVSEHPVFDPQESDPPTFGTPDDGTGEGPTEGPADDATHEKPKRKRAKGVD